MNRQNLMKELEELQKLKKMVMESLKKAPEGRVRSEMTKGKYPQYYLITEDNRDDYPTGRYLRKNEIDLARKLAQKEYDASIMNEINKREKAIKDMLSIEENRNMQNIYMNLPVSKKNLVTPYIMPDEDYVKQWKMDRGEGLNTYPIVNGFQTENGELVRSKSEKIIADKLFLRNIPYKYEAGVRMKQKVLYPDFTLLKLSTHEEVYLEHFGMMDQPEYCKSALEKIEVYENNGIYLGERLFISFESSLKQINLRQIDLLIDRLID